MADLLSIVEWAVRNDVKEFDVTDGIGTTWAVQVGERQPIPVPAYPHWQPRVAVDDKEPDDE